MIQEQLRDGLAGRSLKATLCLYVVGVLMLAPVAVLLGMVLSPLVAFSITPLLVAIVVALEYAASIPSASVPVVGAPRERQGRPSLVEVAVVAAIVIVTIGILLVLYEDVQKKARLAAAERTAERVRAAIARYYNQHGHYPNDLRTLLRPPDFKCKDLNYSYSPETGQFTIISGACE